MKLLIQYVIAAAISMFAIQAEATTIYIDPSYTGSPQNGAQATPYTSWTQLPLSGGKLIAGNTYLQKCGTTATMNAVISVGDNVTIGSYGTGARPWIYSIIPPAGGKAIFVVNNAKNVTIQDMKLQNQYSGSTGLTNGPRGISIIAKSGGNAGTGGHVIQRCEIIGGDVGVDAGSDGIPLGFRITNCEIHHQALDGIYLCNSTNVEIDHCYIHHVNQNYFNNTTVAGGDAIQLDYGCQNAYIHHNLLDRSDTANKFCVIVESKVYPAGTPLVSNNIVVEYNHMIAPIGGTSVYWHHDCNGVLRHNIMEGGARGMFNDNQTGDCLVFDNIFLNAGNVMHVPTNAPFNFYNNTVVGSNSIVTDWTTSTSISDAIKNNIFYLNNSGAQAFSSGGASLSILSSDYNCFHPTQTNMIYWSGSKYSTLASWQNTGKDTHSKDIDPLFVNLATNDFRLQNGSPCKGTGVAIPGITGPGPIDMGANYAAMRSVQIADRSGVYLVPNGAVGGNDFIAFWTYDENGGPSVSDGSGNGNNGSITGATWITGKYGSGLNFAKANGNFVTNGSSSMLNMGSRSFTLAAWIKPFTSPIDGEWRGVFGGAPGAAALGIKQSTRQLLFTKANISDAPTSSYSIPLNVWTHIATTIDSSTTSNNLKYYVNGILVNTVTFTQTFSGVTNYIGCRAATSGYFDGIIDEPEIYNRVLNAFEISEIAQ